MFPTVKHQIAYEFLKKFGVVTHLMIAMALKVVTRSETLMHPEDVRQIVLDLKESGHVTLTPLASYFYEKKRQKKAKKLRKNIEEDLGHLLSDDELGEAVTHAIDMEFTGLTDSQKRHSTLMVRLSDRELQLNNIKRTPGLGYPHHRAVANYTLLLLCDWYNVELFQHTKSEYEIITTVSLKFKEDKPYFESSYTLKNGAMKIGKKPDGLISFDGGKSWSWLEAEASKKKPNYRKEVTDIRLALGSTGEAICSLRVTGLIVAHGYRSSANLILEDFVKQEKNYLPPVLFVFLDVNKRLGLRGTHIGYVWEPNLKKDYFEINNKISNNIFYRSK